MNPNDKSQDRLIDERTAEKLLRQAAELDAERGASMTIDQLRQAAEEAGISREAFDVALSRMPASAPLRHESSTVERQRVSRPSALTAPAVLAAGLWCGMAMVSINARAMASGGSDEGILVLLAAAGLLSLLLATSQRHGAQWRRFLAYHSLLWGGVLAGWWTTHSPRFEIIDDATGIIAGWSLAAGLLGMVIVSIRFRREPEAAVMPNDEGPRTPSRTGVFQRMARGLRRAFGWFEFAGVTSALCLAALAHPVSAQEPDDRKAILATVQRVWDAMRTRDTVLLLQQFDTSARLVGVNARRGPPVVTLTTPSQFGAGIMRAPAGDVWNERMYDPEVRIDGTVAQVWTYYTFHRNATFSHCGFDAVMLVKVGSDWKITQLSDSRRTQGCTHTTPP
jgi:hypothetical protein